MIVLEDPPAGAVRDLAFTGDNQFVAISRDRPRIEDGFQGIEFWDAAGRRVNVVPHDRPAYSFHLHPNGRWAYADTCRRWGEFALLNLATGKDHGLRCVAYHGRGVAVSPDGSRVIASARTNLHPRTKKPVPRDTQDWLMCWRHAKLGRPTLEWERKRTVREPITYRIAFFPAGDRIATYESRHWGATKSHASQLAIRDAATGEYLEKTAGEAADELLVSPDGTRIVSRRGQHLRIWDAARLTADPRVIDEGRAPDWYSDRFECRSLAFHPSGQFLAAASNDDTVKFYDPRTWAVAKTFTWDIGKLRCVAFSPDGTRAAAGSDAGKVVVWDVDI